MRAPARIRLVSVALAVALVASGAARAAADPPGAGVPNAGMQVSLGASAFADGTLRGTPIDLGVGVVVRGVWWQAAVAYGPTALDDGGDGRGLELRAGPRVVRCGRTLYLCGAAGAELGWAHETRTQPDGTTLRHHDVIVDSRVHLLVGFDRAVTMGLDLAVGVRGRFVIGGQHALADGATMSYDPEATPGVVAGAAFFVRR